MRNQIKPRFVFCTLPDGIKIKIKGMKHVLITMKNCTDKSIEDEETLRRKHFLENQQGNKSEAINIP